MQGPVETLQSYICYSDYFIQLLESRTPPPDKTNPHHIASETDILYVYHMFCPLFMRKIKSISILLHLKWQYNSLPLYLPCPLSLTTRLILPEATETPLQHNLCHDLHWSSIMSYPFHALKSDASLRVWTCQNHCTRVFSDSRRNFLRLVIKW